MKATIRDKTYLSNLAKHQVTAIQRTLTIANPKFAEAQKMGRATWGIPRTIELFEWRGDTLILPRGVDLATLGIVADEVTDQRHTHSALIDSTIEPRGYQERAIRLAINAGGGVLVAPTGAGKTTMGIELAARLSQRCLILVKSKDLAEQWRTAIKKFTGLNCGLISSGKWCEGDQFTVGLVQTLVKHEQSLDYGLLICDEAHNTPAHQERMMSGGTHRHQGFRAHCEHRIVTGIAGPHRRRRNSAQTRLGDPLWTHDRRFYSQIFVYKTCAQVINIKLVNQYLIDSCNLGQLAFLLTSRILN